MSHHSRVTECVERLRLGSMEERRDGFSVLAL